MSMTFGNWIGLVAAVAVVVFLIIYKFFLYAVRFGTVVVISRGGKMTYILHEGYHWLKPFDRVEQITLKIGPEKYFSGSRVPLKMQFNSLIKIDVKGLIHEYKILVMFEMTNVEVFLRTDASPMDAFYGMLVAEINRTMQVKPFAWTDVEGMMNAIKANTNKQIGEMGVQIRELKVMWATEDAELQPILKKNELQRITCEMNATDEKARHALELLRLKHEKELILENSNNEAFRRKRQAEIAGL